MLTSAHVRIETPPLDFQRLFSTSGYSGGMLDGVSIAKDGLRRSGAWWRTSSSGARVAAEALKQAGEAATAAGQRDVADTVKLVLKASEPLRDSEQVKGWSHDFAPSKAVPKSLLHLLQQGLKAVCEGAPVGVAGLAGLGYNLQITLQQDLRDRDKYQGSCLGQTTCPTLASIAGDGMMGVVRSRAAADNPALVPFIDGCSALESKAAFFEQYDALRLVSRVGQDDASWFLREVFWNMHDEPRIPDIMHETEVPWAVSQYTRGALSALSVYAARPGHETLGALLAVRAAAQVLLSSGPAGDPAKNRYLGDMPNAEQQSLDRTTLEAARLLLCDVHVPSEEEAQRDYGRDWRNHLDSNRRDAGASEAARRDPDALFGFMRGRVSQAWSRAGTNADWVRLVQGAEKAVGHEMLTLRILALRRLEQNEPCDAVSALETCSHAASLYGDGTRATVREAVEKTVQEMAAAREARRGQAAAAVTVSDDAVTLNGIRIERAQRPAAR